MCCYFYNLAKLKAEGILTLLSCGIATNLDTPSTGGDTVTNAAAAVLEEKDIVAVVVGSAPNATVMAQGGAANATAMAQSMQK